MSEPHWFPPFWTRRSAEIVTVHGEIDTATCELFASVVRAVLEDADAGEPPGDAHLDLAGVDFIGVAGIRVLVGAATKRPPGLELIVYHPPVLLERVIKIGWGDVSGLRLEAPPLPRQSPDLRRVAAADTAGEELSLARPSMIQPTPGRTPAPALVTASPMLPGSSSPDLG
jgi:anti-anti-sigma factor